MKKIKKIKLDEMKIISQLSNGELKYLVGGNYSGHPNDCLLACGGGKPQSACDRCTA